MKQSLIAITILSLMVGCTTISSQAVTTNSEHGVISVNTNATTEIAPDVAEISFAIKTSDTKSIQKATSINKEITEKVYEALKPMINPQNGDYIKTSDFNATPIYSYQNSKKIFEKYEVSNRITIHTKSIDTVGKIIDSAITSGATNVNNLTFSVSDYESQCNELIGNATKKAKTRADIIAKSLTTSLDGISSISTSCSANNQNQPRYFMAKNALTDSASVGGVAENSTIISDGVIKINANVNASFYVK